MLLQEINESIYTNYLITCKILKIHCIFNIFIIYVICIFEDMLTNLNGLLTENNKNAFVCDHSFATSQTLANTRSSN